MFVAGAGRDGRVVDPADGMDPRTRPHPLPSLMQALRRPADPPVHPRTWIGGGDWDHSPFGPLRDRLAADATWTVREIPVGHNIMRHDPDALAAIMTSA